MGKRFSAVLPHHRPDQSRVDGQMAEHVAAVRPFECAVGSDALLDKVAGLLEICQLPYAGDVHSRSVLLYDLRRVVERHVPALLGSFDRTPAATEVDRLNLQPGINRGSANTRAVVAVQRCLAIEQRRLGVRRHHVAAPGIAPVGQSRAQRIAQRIVGLFRQCHDGGRVDVLQQHHKAEVRWDSI